MFGHANPGTDSHGSSGKGEMWWWGAADGHPSSPVELAVVPQKNSRSDDAEDTTTSSAFFVLPTSSVLAAQSDLFRLRFLSSHSSTGITIRIIDPTDVRLPACLERGPKDLWARAQRVWTS
ncbi:unnamed protein product [Closterium sp. Naga37s-1]|nr:unnamed protein product [Closterium sp. Naga37s-1]